MSDTLVLELLSGVVGLPSPSVSGPTPAASLPASLCRYFSDSGSRDWWGFPVYPWPTISVFYSGKRKVQRRDGVRWVPRRLRLHPSARGIWVWTLTGFRNIGTPFLSNVRNQLLKRKRHGSQYCYPKIFLDRIPVKYQEVSFSTPKTTVSWPRMEDHQRIPYVIIYLRFWCVYNDLYKFDFSLCLFMT